MLTNFGPHVMTVWQVASFVALVLQGSLELKASSGGASRTLTAVMAQGVEPPRLLAVPSPFLARTPQQLTEPGAQRAYRPQGCAIGYVALFTAGERESNVIGSSDECMVGVISYAELSLLHSAKHVGARRLLQLLARCVYCHIKTYGVHLNGHGELTSELVGDGPKRLVGTSKKKLVG